MGYWSWASGLVAMGAMAGYVLLWFHGGDLDPSTLKVAVVVLGYLFLLGSSGHVWRLVDWWLDEEAKSRADTDGPIEATDGGQLTDELENGDRTAESDDDESEDDEVSDQTRDVGTVIGKCENVLILTFIIGGAYTGLAIIFTAKGLVRMEKMRKESRYYLAGTMVNFTYSVAVGAVLYAVIQVL